jgi:hypothetical protein
MVRRSNSRAKSRLRFFRISPLFVNGYKNFREAFCFRRQPKCQNTRRWVETHRPYVVCGRWYVGGRVSPTYHVPTANLNLLFPAYIPPTDYHLPPFVFSNIPAFKHVSTLFSVTFRLRPRFSNPDPLFSMTFPHRSSFFKVTRALLYPSQGAILSQTAVLANSPRFEPVSNSIMPEVAQGPLSGPAVLHSRQQAVGNWGKLV